MRDATGNVTGKRRRRADGSRFGDGPDAPKAVCQKGDKNGILGPWPVSPEGPVLLVEGEADAAAAITAGHPAVLATPGSSPGRAVLGALQQVLAGREVIMAPDPDPAGEYWKQTIGSALALAGCSVRFIVPLPGEDLDKRLTRTPHADRPAELARLVEAAVPYQQMTVDENPSAERPRPLTDLGMAERFETQHSGCACFDVREKDWRVWNGKQWTLDRNGLVMRLAHQTARSLYLEAEKARDSRDAEAAAKAAALYERRERLTAMVALAKDLEGMTLLPERWDADRWALNCENGVVDLHTGELRPHDPADHLSRLAPVEYSPQARHDVLDKVLADALPDEEIRAYVQKLFGYALCGEKREKILAFVYGQTDTAKSTLCDAFMLALGDYACTAEPDTFAPKSFNSKGAASPEIAGLAGVRFVLVSETNDGQRLDVGLAKRLTGGENIRARHLYSRDFEFRPQFLICLMSNHRPVVPESDDALWNRLRVVPFDQQVPPDRKDPKIKQTLEHDPAARSALLAWAVEGCLAWQREGLKTPPAVEQATGRYREAMDMLGDFFNDRCVFGRENEVSVRLLRAEYEDWAREVGLKATLSPNKFAEKLRARGCEDFRYTSGVNKGGKGWRGIGLTRTSEVGEAGEATSGKLFLRPPHEGIFTEMTSPPSPPSPPAPSPELFHPLEGGHEEGLFDDYDPF